MSSPPRIVVDRYRILGEAGRGGMGAVWRCLDERLGREVAVKQVGRLPGDSVTDQARALREARSLAALNHPNVVSVYDAVAEDDHVWLVMEFVQGRSLSAILRDEGALPPALVASIGAQVADGLAVAHARGTVHRDVKPGNILISDDGRAKISDFGIARTEGEETLTQAGMFTGTPNYIAPEVARGREAGPAADVWALGATLFAAVEGRPPYDTNPNPLVVLTTIVTEAPPEPQQAGPLTEPIRRMLDRDPEARWSIGEVARALHALQSPEATRSMAAPTSGRPAPPVVHLAKEPRERRRLPVLVAALVVLLLVAAGVGAVLLDRGDEAPVAEGDAPEQPTATAESSEQSPTPSPSEEPEPTQATEPEETEQTDEADPADAGGQAAFVEDYYAGLPGDTESGYERLAPSYRSQTSFQSYDGFWSTIDDVAVQGTAPAGPAAVDVTLVYDGSQQETRRITLEESGESWLIVDDEVVG